MPSSNIGHSDQTRTYGRASSVVFLKTDEPFGGLSNMAGGFPVRVNGMPILTSEALYQACRFPHRPEVQRLIIEQKSPMTAKMKSKPYRRDSRQDWDQVRVKIMRWCLRVKLAQNWGAFSELLLETGERPIVEESRKDDFWGARAPDNGTLVGMNVLGRLLMELREAVKAESRESLIRVQPIAIPTFLLNGQSIGVVSGQYDDSELAPVDGKPGGRETGDRAVLQPSLFEGLAMKEARAPAPLGISTTGVHVAELKPYAEYQESSEAWFGEVPRHWSVLPNRALFGELKDRNHPDEEMLSVTITRGIVSQKTLLEGSSKKDSSNLDKSAYKLVQPRDIAYNKMRAWQGAIGASPLRGIISPAYVVMRLRNAGDLSSYFHYLYRTPQFAKEAERWSYGITSDMWSLRPEHFKMIYTPEPPPDEQAAIVRFLDWANGRLERAIRAKRKVIALLDEQKQAIIHRAVTRGLDPSVPLKPSGIPWLGDVPQHWEVHQLRRLVRPGRRITYGIVQPGEPDPNGRFMIRGQDYSTGWTRPDAIFRVSPAIEAPYSRSRLSAGDLVVTIVGAGVGNVAIIPDWLDGANITQTTARVSIDSSKASPAYVALVLQGPIGKRNVERYVKGAAQPGLNLEHVRIFLLPSPPLAEQLRIVESTKRELDGFDRASSRLEREIELLREYRARLVVDVVTGKLDVREPAARLPDEVPLNSLEEEVDLGDETEAADEEAAA